MLVSATRLRIGIATAGRFHVLDLARELDALGHRVKLYSILTDKRAETFGLPNRCHRSLLPYVAPLAACQRFIPRLIPEAQRWAFVRVLDHAVKRVIEPCDVFICMSGIYVDAARHAANTFGAKVWLERGSRHILSQREILSAMQGVRYASSDVVHRELEGYRLADRIVVPSRHVAESFERDPVAASKLFLNPYGTNLTMFPYRQPMKRASGPLRLIFAGTWSMRKGCDLLEKVVKRCENTVLTHVGSIGDQPFPRNDARFIHLDVVPQSRLADIYEGHDVFVHSSREEGLSVVLAQALASGLPVICSDRTGGYDLGHTQNLRGRIKVVQHDDLEALHLAIENIRKELEHGTMGPALEPSDLVTLSWLAYAKRYHYELSTAFKSK